MLQEGWEVCRVDLHPSYQPGWRIGAAVEGKIPLEQSGQIDFWHSRTQPAFLELDGNDAVLMWNSGKLRAGW